MCQCNSYQNILLCLNNTQLLCGTKSRMLLDAPTLVFKIESAMRISYWAFIEYKAASLLSFYNALILNGTEEEVINFFQHIKYF